MSRSGYTDDCDDDLAAGRWRGIIASATRGKRGQAFFADLVFALESMPVKRLISEELCQDGDVCALGALGVKRGIDMSGMDPEDADHIGATFGIAAPLAQEVVFQNDEQCDRDTPEQRWIHMHAWAKSQLKVISSEEPEVKK